jgi:Leucine-rich repeat (LRR) protein
MSTKFVYVSKGTKVRYVEPRAGFSPDELDAFLAEQNCSDVVLNETYGMGQHELDLALACTSIKSLSIVLKSASLVGLAANRSIERVYFGGQLVRQCDFSEAKQIRHLDITWQEGVIGLERMDGLQELRLTGFAEARLDLRQLFFLKVLALVQPRLESLDFLQAFTRLQHLEVSYPKALRSLAGLSAVAESLEELDLDHVSNAESYPDSIGELRLLKTLRLTKCHPLSDIEFIRELPCLESFAFVDTKVLSGDLTPCLELKYVGFLENKKYNCTWNRDERRLERKPEKPSPSARASGT